MIDDVTAGKNFGIHLFESKLNLRSSIGKEQANYCEQSGLSKIFLGPGLERLY